MLKNPGLKQKLLFLLFGFLALFLLRLVYGYLAYPQSQANTVYSGVVRNQSFSLQRKNYASKKMAYKTSVTRPASQGGQAGPGTVDQKYEKIGAMTTSTQKYEEDEKALYSLIKDEKLMIQFEQSSGLKSARRLNIALGVIPDKFDSTIASLRKIGKLQSIQIDKKDKTNEYKKLEAKRISLEKARKTLLDLNKGKGDVGDMIGLVNRLLEVENQIQTLGVSLGEFDSQNEFCTVKFTLHEKRKAKPISFMHRLYVAGAWATKIYLVFWLIIFLGLGAIWLAITVLAAGYKLFIAMTEEK